MKAFLLILIFVTVTVGQTSSSTARRIRGATTLPATCRSTNPVDVFVDTDATAANRFYICTSTNTWTAQGGSGTIAGSTGATDNAILRADGTGGGTLQSSGNTIDDSNNTTLAGNLLFTADNTKDIGATAATRPRDIHVARSVGIGTGAPGVAGEINVNSTAHLGQIDVGNGWSYISQGSAGGYALGSGQKICWTSTSTNTSNPATGDICLMRNGAGVLELTEGNTGTLRDITFRNFKGSGTGAAQFRTAQTTAPTCSTNCGTSPSVVGTDTFMTVTMGSSGSPASGWVVTFNGTWPAAPSCHVQMGKAGMVVGKMALTAVTTTTTITVVTNGTAPSTTDIYHVQCGGLQ
jgi:hypothetical protein